MNINDIHFEKEYKKVKRKVNFRLFVISLVISFGLTIAIHLAFFYNYTVLKSSFFGIVSPIPINLILSLFPGTLLLTTGLILLLKKQLIIKSIPKEYKKKAEKKAEKESISFTEGDKIIPSAILFIAAAIVAIGIISVHNFGYNDDEIRFLDSHKIVVTTAKYSDFELFKLEACYDEGKTINYDGPAYGIVSHDGKRSYDFGNVSEELEKKLLSQYHHRYKDVETIDDAITMNKERK